MNFKLFCSFILLCLFFITPSYQYGILRVEEIWSNNDIPNVKIEDMVITESQIYIDYIEDLSGEGVTVEDVIFSDGSITVPGDFLTCCGVEFKSALFSNGGIFADNGEGGFSFTVEDNTGNVDIQGVTRIQGGANVSDKFFVDGITGDTIIEGLLHPNGGIFVNGNAVVLSNDGQLDVSSSTQVNGPVYFGESSSTSNRVITRLASEGLNGGSTYLQGQNGAETGGDIILEPGNGAVVGNIFFGSSRNSDLFFGRTALSNTNNGGTTEFSGQTSITGNGGDLFLDGGNSGSIGFGGDIIIAPGLSFLDGKPGSVIIGTPDGLEASHDLTLGRPPLISGNGGETIFQGQTTAVGHGGNFYLRGGNVNSGTGNPGDLILTPGVSTSGVSTVILGKNTATKLNVRRPRVAESGGQTIFLAQNGTAGIGGDLYLRGGESGLGDDGGNVYLMPGSTVTGKSGEIILGHATEALVFTRPTVSGGVLPGFTGIAGQFGNDGSGGDLFIAGGRGISQGGDVHITGGSGSNSVGGAAVIIGGPGESKGGEITILAGNGYQRNGGDIGISTEGGDILVTTRGSTSDGKIIVGPSAGRFYVDEIPLRIEGANIRIRGGSDVVTIANNPNAIISWNGVPVLKRTQIIPAVRATTPVTASTVRADVSDISVDFNNILQALNQCGHGLISSIIQPNNVIEQC